MLKTGRIGSRDTAYSGVTQTDSEPVLRSERNIVVHIAVACAGTGRHSPARCGTRWPARTKIAARLIGPETAATAAAAAIEHGQRRVEALQHHLGRIFLDAALVGPFAGLQCALDVNLGALLQILLDNLAKRFGKNHDAMPLGLFLAFAGRLVTPGFRRRDAQIGDRPAILRPPDFRILAEVTDQNHLVYASRHRCSPLKITGLAEHRPSLRISLSALGYLKATLYACSHGPLGDPAAIPRLSTYSIARQNVPVLFRATCRKPGPGGISTPGNPKWNLIALGPSEIP